MGRKKETHSKNYIQRDVSWLAFNARVLEEALDPNTPLLEQVKFLSIFSSNLDEFFMVRIAGIMRQESAEPQMRHGAAAYLPGELLHELEHETRVLVARQYHALNEKILPALRSNGIRLCSWKELTAEFRKSAESYFEREMLPVLTPIGIDPSHPFPLVPNLALELLVRLRRKGRECFAVLEVPTVIPRFIQLDDSAAEGQGGTFVPAEEIISNNLSMLFSGSEILECTPFRITRDMDFSLDEESTGDLVSEMQSALLEKTKRSVVRLEIARGVSAKSRTWLLRMLDIKEHLVFDIPGCLNLKSFFEIASLPGYPHLSDEPMPPLDSPFCPASKSMFENIREHGSFLIHHPYESFDPVLRLLEEAAEDPRVLAIKQTLYRVSRNSPVVAALVKAARNGKQVSVLFEIKARFDEENNIRASRELADAGAHVVYGIAGLKVHCKALLIVRRESAGIRRYLHLSTGNYNQNTARQYTDLGFFTDDDLLARDVAGLFNVITGLSDPPEWNKLLVAPFTLKDRLISMIDRETKLSRPGKPGHIILKVNAIIDYEVIDHLLAAAEAGVRIDLIVRGICGLNPSALAPEIRRNVRIISILDRFLEHSRIYYFANNGDPEYFIGSADVMPRNLLRRIEILFPVDDPELRGELSVILSAALHDRRKGRIMKKDNVYSHTAAMRKYEKTRSQYVLREYYEKRQRKHKEAHLKNIGRLTVYRERK